MLHILSHLRITSVVVDVYRGTGVSDDDFVDDFKKFVFCVCLQCMRFVLEGTSLWLAYFATKTF